MKPVEPLIPRALLRWGVRLFILLACTAVVFLVLHPSLLLQRSTANGGDMGAHIWGPDFLRRELFTKLRFTGWTGDWYAGFPALTFYFPFPSIVIAFFSLIIPYTITFKLVTVAGMLSLPACAYAFGKMTNQKSPRSELMAVAMLIYLFDTSYSIYGGNIASTLAGEFSFSIGLSLSLLFLGTFWQGLTNGKFRARSAILLGLTILSHLLTAIFAVIGAVVMLLFHLNLSQGKTTKYVGRTQFTLIAVGALIAIMRFTGLDVSFNPAIFFLVAAVLMILHVDRKRLFNMSYVGILGAMLAGFWLIPFVARLRFSNDMGWEKETKYLEWILKGDLRFIVPIAVIALVLSIVRGNKIGQVLGVYSVLVLIIFVAAPQGQLWNARALPFWNISILLLAAIGVGEIFSMGAELWESRYSLYPTSSDMSIVSLLVPFLALIITIGALVSMMALWPKSLNSFNSKSPLYVRSWANWNYQGYENKPAYPEYKDIIDTMKRVSKEHGCGRADWEYESQEDRFGTPMALMLLPYWTNSCVGSMEGLYFESSATTPYHFLSQSEVSAHPSNPMRDLPYSALNLDDGVRHMQLLGVKYYLTITPEAEELAKQNPNLEQVGQTKNYSISYDDGAKDRTWKVWLVKNAPMVEGLANQPAVLRSVTTNASGASQVQSNGVVGSLNGATNPLRTREGWLEVNARWFMNKSQPSAFLGNADDTVYFTETGPKDWQRVDVSIKNPESSTGYFDTPKTHTRGEFVSYSQPQVRPLPKVNVTMTSKYTDSDDIKFDVDKVGVPVIVKTSYFPNWTVKGAKGPFRASPNMMIVIPTSTHVSMHYGRTPIDYMGILSSILAIVGIFVIWRKGDLKYETDDSEYWMIAREYSSSPMFKTEKTFNLEELQQHS